MVIRDATMDDIPALVAMGQRFRASSSYADVIADNPAQMAKTAETLIAGESGAVWVAEDAGGALVGMLGFVLAPNHISGELTAGEVFWFNEGRSGYGGRLLVKAIRWAQAQGATKLQMIAPADRQDVAEMYTKLGMRAVETTWQMSVSA